MFCNYIMYFQGFTLIHWCFVITSCILGDQVANYFISFSPGRKTLFPFPQGDQLYSLFPRANYFIRFSPGRTTLFPFSQGELLYSLFIRANYFIPFSPGRTTLFLFPQGELLYSLFPRAKYFIPFFPRANYCLNSLFPRANYLIPFSSGLCTVTRSLAPYAPSAETHSLVGWRSEASILGKPTTAPIRASRALAPSSRL